MYCFISYINDFNLFQNTNCKIQLKAEMNDVRGVPNIELHLPVPYGLLFTLTSN